MCGKNKTARQFFIIRVYAIAAAMLAFTAACVVVATTVPAAGKALKKVDWVVYIGGVLGVILMLIIIVGKKWSRKTPQNYILLVLFTICWSVMITCLT